VGRRLVEEFNRIVKIIGEHPGIGHPSSATERVLSLRRFKYAVIYQEAPLLILALRHHARRPSYGRGRR
jgi:plasmid stabilization system protein ParE